jgi:hypothetical protein
MANTNRKNRPTPKAPPVASAFDEARDELFQHIMRCGVVGTAPEDQAEWFNDTMQYMADRFPELDADRLAQLRTLGERFSQPPKRRDADGAASAA